MRKARKCDNVAASPGPPHCRPLSLKEKRRLSRLREEGRTWNDIASWFPGKKKGTLQRIYYTQLKNSSNPMAKTHQHSKHHPSTADDLYTEGTAQSAETINVPVPAEKPVRCSRYFFWTRHVAWWELAVFLVPSKIQCSQVAWSCLC